MFSWETVRQFLFSPFILQAAWTTLWISVVAQILGVVIGLFLALMRMSRFSLLSLRTSLLRSRSLSPLVRRRPKPQAATAAGAQKKARPAWTQGLARAPLLSIPAQVYIWFFRGSPLLVQILLLWDGLPKIFPTFLLSSVACVLIAFSLNEGAYMAEIIRAGITSVDPGQLEAARALGMRYSLAMRRIVLPQAARIIVPPLGNEFNNMLKTTSLASVIGLLELTGTAEIFGSPTFSIFELLIVATFYYLILTTLWDYVQRWIEKRLDPDRMGKVELPPRKGMAQRILGVDAPRADVIVLGGPPKEGSSHR